MLGGAFHDTICCCACLAAIPLGGMRSLSQTGGAASRQARTQVCGLAAWAVLLSGWLNTCSLIRRPGPLHNMCAGRQRAHAGGTCFTPPTAALACAAQVAQQAASAQIKRAVQGSGSTQQATSAGTTSARNVARPSAGEIAGVVLAGAPLGLTIAASRHTWLRPPCVVLHLLMSADRSPPPRTLSLLAGNLVTATTPNGRHLLQTGGAASRQARTQVCGLAAWAVLLSGWLNTCSLIRRPGPLHNMCAGRQRAHAGGTCFTPPTAALACAAQVAQQAASAQIKRAVQGSGSTQQATSAGTTSARNVARPSAGEIAGVVLAGAPLGLTIAASRHTWLRPPCVVLHLLMSADRSPPPRTLSLLAGNLVTATTPSGK
jgi:hypothetical protein